MNALQVEIGSLGSCAICGGALFFTFDGARDKDGRQVHINCQKESEAQTTTEGTASE